MANINDILLSRESCMSCGEEDDILMSRCTYSEGMCEHKFCQSCFRKENAGLDTSLDPIFNCACCHTIFYEKMKYIDEAIIIGKAATLRFHIYPQLIQPGRAAIATEEVIHINKMNELVITQLESALLLNPINIDTLYLICRCCFEGTFLINNKLGSSSVEFYSAKILIYSYKLLDQSLLMTEYWRQSISCTCYYQLGCIFHTYHNYPAALKYSKLAYEHCLRSSDHTNLSRCKDLFIKSRNDFAKLPPLLFAVGDEVEFLHELETGSEWKLGKIVELYYRERSFAISFTAPYRLQLLSDSDSADQPSVYAWVKADLDRYVRKVGVRSIEDTRYQARLDAKVEALAQVHCTKEFIHDLSCELARDQEFVEMLQSVWHIELSEDMLGIYNIFVMGREPLVRTDSGYYVPSSEEVIARIKASFDPAHLSSDAAPSAAAGEDRYSQQIRAFVIGTFQGNRADLVNHRDDDVQGLLLQSIRSFIKMVACSSSVSTAGMCDCCKPTVLPEISDAISKASTDYDYMRMLYLDDTRADEDFCTSKSGHYVIAWYALFKCFDNPNAGAACECPYVYFFVKSCLDQGLGVPKLALALYDRMNMQLSREFIRCANPTCELNRLDQSTGHLKFKKCSRCQAVIYCSRECQVSHHPEHKMLCWEHGTDREGS